MTTDHERYMDLALEKSREARMRGNWPVASVIVRDGQIVGEGANSAYSDPDATAHAEVAAIRDACRRLKTHDLAGCTLYTAMEPCPMCLWALIEANIARVVMGARHAGVGRTDLGRYSVESMLAFTGRQMDVVTGVRERECTALRVDWLKTRK
jgi:tRNA(Arg) A34 adenosine deaminase TadA